MSEDESLRKTNASGAPATGDAGSDSLDFTGAGPAAPPAEPRVDHATPLRRVSPRKRAHTAVPVQAAPRRASRIAVLLLVVAAIGVAAYALTERASDAPAPTPAKARPFQTPTHPPQQAAAPAAKAPVLTSTPAETLTIQPPALPAEFLQLFQTYRAKPAPKAIALALDPGGRWAYGSIAGYSTQAEASDEALSECSRFKATSDIKEKCRLYAVGDKVVW